MTLLGLHPLDATILVCYVLTVIFIGQHLSRKNKTEDDYFLGGRKMGRWFQFFLNLGNMADPSSASVTCASVYKDGIGGIWLLLIPLFLTPYYWFMSVWFRRVRLTTMADLFQDRFASRFLGTLYAVVAIAMAILLIGLGNIIALKTLQPIMIKDSSGYNDADRKMIAEYNEYETLHNMHDHVGLTSEQAQRYEVVKELYELGQIHPYVSYLRPIPFYLFSNILIAVIIIMGGLTATAVIDGIQSILILVVSFILIPIGLVRIGGFHALHAKVAPGMFHMFGDINLSEYTWYSIAAFLFLNFVGINAAAGNMNIGGSAKDEMAARLGAVSGGFAKRFLTIGWGMTGLIALAIWGPNQMDSDQIWGGLTLLLLPVGLIGLMIVGILGGKLSQLGSQSVVLSALVVKNLYEPLVPGRTERHYMFVARISVSLVLGLGICVALFMGNALSLLKFMIGIGPTWGAPIFLIFVWRRVTKISVITQVILTLLVIGIIPFVVSSITAMRQSTTLTAMTKEVVTKIRVAAAPEDVSAGQAAKVGEMILMEHHSEPVSIFYEDGVARINPADPNSPKEGLGRFNIEVYLVSLLGVNVNDLSPAMLLTIRFLFDALFPFSVLFVLSLLSPTEPAERINCFYARLKTPIAATAEADAIAVALSNANPARFDHARIFPNSNWEFMKWDKADAIGFLACLASVGIILIIFQAILLIGA